MTDLIFVHHKPDDFIPEEDFQIVSESDRGDLWLIDNTDTTSTIPDMANMKEAAIPSGDAWVKTKAEFDRLYAKALADGLAVRVEP